MYDLIDVKPKLDIKKIVVFIILLFFCVILAIFFVMKNNKNENNKIDVNDVLQVSSQDIKFQVDNTINKEKIISTKGFTDEQLQKIENIYANNGEKIAFLTFDDGPSKTVTPHILDILKNEDVKATFFVLGNRVEYAPELVKRAFDEGHYIANHGYSHQYSSIYTSIEMIFNEYNKTEICIRNAIQNENYHSNLFRFPGGSVGGKYNNLKQQAKEELKENKIAYLDWNALSNDSAGAKTKEELMENIKNTVGNKDSVVILMHDAGDKILTYEILPDVINYLKQKGYKFQNIYDILK